MVDQVLYVFARFSVRGFGLVWRESLGGAEAWIGWATGGEVGGVAVIQPFAGGTLYRGVNGVTYALFTDGTWGSMGTSER